MEVFTDPVTEEMIDAAMKAFEMSPHRTVGVYMERSVCRDMLEAVTYPRVPVENTMNWLDPLKESIYFESVIPEAAYIAKRLQLSYFKVNYPVNDNGASVTIKAEADTIPHEVDMVQTRLCIIADILVYLDSLEANY